jgi:multiple sugar transport system ATP-binding protein
MASVELIRLTKRYDSHSAPAVRDVSLRVEDGEFMVFLGPSGCGKSTTLRMIAGLEPISDGTLLIDGKAVNDVPARDRDIAMVFQSYALYPHMTVLENMAFGLRRRSIPRAEVDRRVRDAADILALTPYLSRRPHALSGGQRQRVAVGRAIVRDPKVFLFDEPLSNLDAALRVSTRAELTKLHARLRTTMIYVTHDQVEAMTMGTRICIMHGGAVMQVGAPMEVYARPQNTFVAGFLGSPPMNLLDVEGEEGAVRLGAAVLPMPGARPGKLTLGVRPEDLSVNAAGSIRGTVSSVEPLGAETILGIAVPGVARDLLVRAGREPPARRGEAVTLTPSDGGLHLFDPRDGARLS